MMEGFQFPPFLSASRKAGTEKSPLTSDRAKPLREISGRISSPDGRESAWYVMTLSGHGSIQLQQRTHSLTRIAVEGRHPPSQFRSHILQSLHISTSFPMRQTASRLISPNNAPKGQMNLQYMRGIKRFARSALKKTA